MHLCHRSRRASSDSPFSQGRTSLERAGHVENYYTLIFGFLHDLLGPCERHPFRALAARLASELIAFATFPVRVLAEASHVVGQASA